MITINPIVVSGPWVAGCSLDVHTVSSVPIGENAAGHMQFDTTRSEVGELVYRLKYQGDQSAVPAVAEVASHLVTTRWPGVFDAVVSVPPTTPRRVQPLDLVVDAIASRLGLPYLRGGVASTPGGPSLKDIRDVNERSKALEGRFSARSDLVARRNLLLVDDLYRSGLTAEAVTNVLLAGGAQGVYLLTMTKTRSNR